MRSSSQLYAIASRDALRAEEAAAHYDIPQPYGSYEELLDDPHVDVVYIPLPNHLHCEWVEKAADAGKHILCEKPLTLNAKEAAHLQAYCRDKNVQLMEAFMYKFHPRWQYLREILRNGEIGQIQAIQTNFSFYNDDDENIRNKYRDGGGAIYDIGCYSISTARFITGAEPDRVISLIDRKSTFGIDTLCSAILDFGTVQAQFTVGIRNFPRQQVQIFGTGGHISVDMPFNAYNDVSLNLCITTHLGTRHVNFAPADQYLLEIEAFSQAIQSAATTPIPIQDAVNNMAVIDAIFASEEKQNWVDVVSYT